MNKNRRNRLRKVIQTLEQLSEETERKTMETTLDESQQEVELVADEEQEALDCMPENLQFSQRYSDISDNVDDLQDASAELEIALSEYQEKENPTFEDVEENINDAVQYMNNAIDR